MNRTSDETRLAIGLLLRLPYEQGPLDDRGKRRWGPRVQARAMLAIAATEGLAVYQSDLATMADLNRHTVGRILPTLELAGWLTSEYAGWRRGANRGWPRVFVIDWKKVAVDAGEIRFGGREAIKKPPTRRRARAMEAAHG